MTDYGEDLQRLGGAEKIDPNKAIEDAVKLASQCDAAIIVCGLTPEWESEGFDRPSLDLPGRQDELIAKVGRVNASTIVVMQSVSLNWPDSSLGHSSIWLCIRDCRVPLLRCLGSTGFPESSKLGIKETKLGMRSQMFSSARSIHPVVYHLLSLYA